jgi:hypothetical protein
MARASGFALAGSDSQVLLYERTTSA